MEVKVVSADAVFRAFTACPTDPKALILDVRDKKHFDRGHVAGAYCIRVPSNGATLLDYSKAEYEVRWSQDCWWDRDVIVYGDAGLKRDHPVLAFLSKDKHARSVSVFREGLEAFQKQYPFLVTTSLKSGASNRRYPSQLDPLLYLGDWDHAAALDRHAELGIKAIITIHNNPSNLKLPPGKYNHMKIELADIDTADISAHIRPAYDFIEEARATKKAVLVHCGAGVSRSATLSIAWLMRKNRWSAQQALEFAKSRRSLVAPNDGFWRTLCTLEAQLGIAERSNVDAFAGFHGADAKAADTNEPAPTVRVTFVPPGATSAPAGSKAQTAAAAAPPAAAKAAAPASAAARRREQGPDGGRGRRERSRERSRERRDGGHERRRSRSRSRERQRERRRSRSRERRRSRSKDRSRRSRSRSREQRRRDERGERDGREGGAAAAIVAQQAALQQQQQQQQERVDIESTAGVVLEVVREGKSLGHLVLEMQRVSQEAIFGRLPSCEVPMEHLSISRAHARLTTDGAGSLLITDLGSAHGTNVDGAWIKSKVPKQLRQGSVLKFGASSREYRVTKLPQPPSRR